MNGGGTAVADSTTEASEPPRTLAPAGETVASLPVGVSTPFRRGATFLQDSLLFLTLSVAAAAIFGLTWGLFRSFEAHRAALGREWSERGRQALAAGHPADAVTALRTALGYEPNERDDELLLAEALASAGRTEEANNYFLNLREQAPGDGYVNLQLARLARQRKDPESGKQAINYYEAALNGSWQGDGASRRRRVRLELSDYLVSRHETQAARSELLIAAGNAPENAGFELLFGDRLRSIGDTEDALHFYRKAMAEDPHDHVPSERAGRLALDTDDYEHADEMLSHALRQMPEQMEMSRQHEPNAKVLREEYAKQRASLAAAEAEAHKLAELNFTRDQPSTQRAERLLSATTIAKARLGSCSATSTPPPAGPVRSAAEKPVPPPPLQALTIRWKSMAPSLRPGVLARDAVAQDMLEQLIADTENTTAGVCGQPTGDDALLLRVVRSPRFTQSLQLERP